MKRFRILTMFVLVTLPLRVFAIAPYVDDDWRVCGSLLMKHVDSPISGQEPWDRLPDYLGDVGAGTLLVQLVLPRGEYASDLVTQLTSPLRGLQIPDALKMIHGSHYVFVVNGRSGPLQRFYQRIKDSSLGETASFQFLDFTRAQAAATYPAILVQFDEQAPDRVREKVEHEIWTAMNAGGSDFAVHLLRSHQMIYFTPSHTLLPRITSEFWTAEKIETSIAAEAPVKWTDWLLKKANDLNNRRAILVGDWAVLSPIAYGKSLSLAQVANSKQPSVAAVDTALRTALNNCFSLSCEIEPKLMVDVPPIAPYNE